MPTASSTCADGYNPWSILIYATHLFWGYRERYVSLGRSDVLSRESVDWVRGFCQGLIRDSGVQFVTKTASSVSCQRVHVYILVTCSSLMVCVWRALEGHETPDTDFCTAQLFWVKLDYLWLLWALKFHNAERRCEKRKKWKGTFRCYI